DYIRNRYGNDSVTQIITFGTLGSRAVIRDVGRVLDIPISEVDPIAKQIPHGAALNEALEQVPELQFLIRSKPEYQKMWELALKLEGLSRHASVHPSAVVITPRPLLEFLPLYRMSDGETCTQYDMYTLETLGVLKMDILGLRTLTVIEEAEKLIRERLPEFRIENIDFSERSAYELLQQGETVGLFQLESAGMRNLCKQTQPAKLEDIIDLIALYRPGPMRLIPKYVERKNNPAKIEYDHPLLEPFCRNTCGIIIYQEQVMQAAQALAGYTLGQADILRQAMGKKKLAEMAAQRETFIAGCEKKIGLSRERAQEIFDLLQKFAGYGFNKSHATGYACLSYITAYLKANYPKEFIAASLTSEIGNSDNLAKFINEARRMGLKVLSPDINRSSAHFTIEENAVRFGLGGVKNVGTGAAEMIVIERQTNGPYESLIDFLLRTRGKVNRKAVESLIKAGAFSSFNANRTQLLAELETSLTKIASEKLLFYERQFQLFGAEPEEFEAKPNASDTLRTIDIINYEKEALGFYFSSHPLERYRLEYTGLHLTPITELENLDDGAAVVVGGIITNRKVRKDRRDRDYLILTLEDFTSSIEVMVFNNTLENCRDILKTDNLVIIQGKVKMRYGGETPATNSVPQLWADAVYNFDRVSQFIKKIVIQISAEELNDNLTSQIRTVLSAYPGEIPVTLILTNPPSPPRRLLLKNYPVRLEPKLLTALIKLVGADRVKLRGALPQTNSRNFSPAGNRQ
ncbi:MAG: DNA polymerase III subunit alpha, partial [bacterium]